MAHSNCGWTCGCADKTVKSLENTCHTWALLGWCFTKRRYIKCTYSTCVPLPCCMQCTGSFDASMLVHAAVIRHFINNLCMREREREWVRGGGVETACHSWCLWVTCAGVTTVLCLSATGRRGAARRGAVIVCQSSSNALPDCTYWGADYSTTPLWFDRATTMAYLCGLLHCGLHKHIGHCAASGLRHCDLNDLW